VLVAETPGQLTELVLQRLQLIEVILVVGLEAVQAASRDKLAEVGAAAI
jgi:hypothetical protein